MQLTLIWGRAAGGLAEIRDAALCAGVRSRAFLEATGFPPGRWCSSGKGAPSSMVPKKSRSCSRARFEIQPVVEYLAPLDAAVVVIDHRERVCADRPDDARNLRKPTVRVRHRLAMVWRARALALKGSVRPRGDARGGHERNESLRHKRGNRA